VRRSTILTLIVIVAIGSTVSATPAPASVGRQALDKQYCDDLAEYLDASTQIASQLGFLPAADQDSDRGLVLLANAPAMELRAKRVASTGDPSLHAFLTAQQVAWSAGTTILRQEVEQDDVRRLALPDESLADFTGPELLDRHTDLRGRSLNRLVREYLPTTPQLSIESPLAAEPTFAATGSACGVVPEIRDCSMLFPVAEAAALVDDNLVATTDPKHTCAYTLAPGGFGTTLVWVDVYPTPLTYRRLGSDYAERVRGVGDAAKTDDNVRVPGATHAECGQRLWARAGTRTVVISHCGGIATREGLIRASKAVIPRLG
jgi:hypothetical protein